jgi:hypothetical protein
MGLFTNGDLNENVVITSKIVEAVCRYVNDDVMERTAQPRIRVRSSYSQLLHVCRSADEVFSAGAFPPDPGPYKRAAAFVVLGRMYPVFDVEILLYSGATLSNHQRIKEQVAWISRLALTALPAIFGRMMVTLDGAPQQLPEWKGYPSDHVALEVTNWIKWLQHHDQYQNLVDPKIDWPNFCLERRIRAVLALSLILENAHYAVLGDERHRLIGRVGECLANLTDEQKLDLHGLDHSR